MKRVDYVMIIKIYLSLESVDEQSQTPSSKLLVSVLAMGQRTKCHHGCSYVYARLVLCRMVTGWGEGREMTWRGGRRMTSVPNAHGTLHGFRQLIACGRDVNKRVTW